jgi:hypothetical protein
MLSHDWETSNKRIRIFLNNKWVVMLIIWNICSFKTKVFDSSLQKSYNLYKKYPGAASESEFFCMIYKFEGKTQINVCS